MVDLATTTAESFSPFLGETFEAIFTDGRLPLTLVEVRALGSGRPGAARQPFALTFHGAPNLRLPQHIYPLQHASFGTAEIFLVQVAGDANAAKFEAVFT